MHGEILVWLRYGITLLRLIIRFTVFLIPTHVLYLTAFALLWMLVRDTFILVTLEFGHIIDLLLFPVQVFFSERRLFFLFYIIYIYIYIYIFFFLSLSLSDCIFFSYYIFFFGVSVPKWTFWISFVLLDFMFIF